ELVRGSWDAPPLRVYHTSGYAANAMSAERAPDDRLVFYHSDGQALIVGVGLTFLLEDWHWPAALCRQNRLVIPVSAFNEVNINGSVAPSSPLNEAVKVLLCVPQVGLQRDPEVRVIAQNRPF